MTRDELKRAAKHCREMIDTWAPVLPYSRRRYEIMEAAFLARLGRE